MMVDTKLTARLQQAGRGATVLAHVATAELHRQTIKGGGWHMYRCTVDRMARPLLAEVVEPCTSEIICPSSFASTALSTLAAVPTAGFQLPTQKSCPPAAQPSKLP